ncbi:MAG: hypothetical protein GTO03_01045 [Planctomycetales bacterium]|nr:hypothetical protein [Planctomycetales bacterium]
MSAVRFLPIPLPPRLVVRRTQPRLLWSSGPGAVNQLQAIPRKSPTPDDHPAAAAAPRPLVLAPPPFHSDRILP